MGKKTRRQRAQRWALMREMEARHCTSAEILAAAAKLKRQQNRPKKPAPPPKRSASVRPAAPPRGIPYSAYLQSEWWLYKRAQKLASVNHQCERCNGRATQVHHKHYRSLGRERHRHLEAVCGPCHEREHETLIQADRHLRAIMNPAE